MTDRILQRRRCYEPSILRLSPFPSPYPNAKRYLYASYVITEVVTGDRISPTSTSIDAIIDIQGRDDCRLGLAYTFCPFAPC